MACLGSGTPSNHRLQTEGDDEVVQISDGNSGSQDLNTKRPKTANSPRGEHVFSGKLHA
jgi:hypothetical protein